MPQIITIVLTAFYMLWLCTVLWFLWRIWRNGARYTQRLEQTQLDAALTAAQAAQTAAEAARLLAAQLCERSTQVP